jgi:hypothetical protein
VVLDVERSEERTTLEVQVPVVWWHDPPKNWGQGVPAPPTWHMQRVRRYVRNQPPAQQRALLREWQDWYEGRLSSPKVFVDRGWFAQPGPHPTEGRRRIAIEPPGPPKPAERNALRYLCLAAQLLEAVPVRQEPDPPEAPPRPASAPLAGAVAWLGSSGEQGPDLRGVTRDGFRWEAREGDLELAVENLGNRRIRVEVVLLNSRMTAASPWEGFMKGVHCFGVFVAHVCRGW